MKCSNKLLEHCIEEAKLSKIKTSFQIRIFDDKTGAVTYKHLSSNELNEILRVLDQDKNNPLEWIEMRNR